MHALRVLFLSLCFATCAQAERFPALYDVTGVDAGDVLNIRNKPTTKSQVLDHFDASETAIEVLGSDPGGNWAKVFAGEQMGWAALRFLARQDGQDSGFLPDTLQCYGNEPFWNFAYQAHATSTLDRLGLGEIGIEMSPLAMTAGGGQTHGAIGRSGDNDIVAIAITRESCSDGMSDLEFGLGVVVIHENAFGADVLSGCCSLN